MGRSNCCKVCTPPPESCGLGACCHDPDGDNINTTCEDFVTESYCLTKPNSVFNINTRCGTKIPCDSNRHLYTSKLFRLGSYGYLYIKADGSVATWTTRDTLDEQIYFNESHIMYRLWRYSSSNWRETLYDTKSFYDGQEIDWESIPQFVIDKIQPTPFGPNGAIDFYTDNVGFFAIKKRDGTFVCWGPALDYGPENETPQQRQLHIEAELEGSLKLVFNGGACLALKLDGTVTTVPLYGTHIHDNLAYEHGQTIPQEFEDELKNLDPHNPVIDIFSCVKHEDNQMVTTYAMYPVANIFCALMKNGDAYVWGGRSTGKYTNIKEVHGGANNIHLISNDGKLYTTWDTIPDSFTFNIPVVRPPSPLLNVKNVYTSRETLVVLKEDNTIEVYGNTSLRGLTPEILSAINSDKRPWLRCRRLNIQSNSTSFFISAIVPESKDVTAEFPDFQEDDDRYYTDCRYPEDYYYSAFAGKPVHHFKPGGSAWNNFLDHRGRYLEDGLNQFDITNMWAFGNSEGADLSRVWYYLAPNSDLLNDVVTVTDDDSKYVYNTFLDGDHIIVFGAGFVWRAGNINVRTGYTGRINPETYTYPWNDLWPEPADNYFHFYWDNFYRNGIKSVVSNGGAFCVLKENGSVVTIGNNDRGGYYRTMRSGNDFVREDPLPPNFASPVKDYLFERVISNNNSFCGERIGGGVVCWNRALGLIQTPPNINLEERATAAIGANGFAKYEDYIHTYEGCASSSNQKDFCKTEESTKPSCNIYTGECDYNLGLNYPFVKVENCDECQQIKTDLPGSEGWVLLYDIHMPDRFPYLETITNRACYRDFSRWPASSRTPPDDDLIFSPTRPTFLYTDYEGTNTDNCTGNSYPVFMTDIRNGVEPTGSCCWGVVCEDGYEEYSPLPDHEFFSNYTCNKLKDCYITTQQRCDENKSYFIRPDKGDYSEANYNNYAEENKLYFKTYSNWQANKTCESRTEEEQCP